MVCKNNKSLWKAKESKLSSACSSIRLLENQLNWLGQSKQYWVGAGWIFVPKQYAVKLQMSLPQDVIGVIIGWKSTQS